MSIKLSSNTNILSGNRLKVNDSIIQYNKIICISPDGDDTSGDGSVSNPYKSLYKAQQDAIDNTCILFGIGTFILGNSIVESWKDGSVTEYALAYFYQKTGKSIDIVGQGYETLVICTEGRPSNTSTERYRDIHLIYPNVKSLARMNIKYRGTDWFDSTGHTGFTGRYQNTIFYFNSCIIHNCYIEVMGNWFAMQYYNSSGSNGGSILNSIIKSNGYGYADFNDGNASHRNNGLKTVKDTLIDVEYSGYQTVKTNVIVREITDEDISYGDTSIGVYSGPYAWERKDNPKFLSKIIPQSDGSYKEISGYTSTIDSGPNVPGNYPVLVPQDSSDYPITNYDSYIKSEYGSPRSLSVTYGGFNILRLNNVNNAPYDISEFTMRFWVKLYTNPGANNPYIFQTWTSVDDVYHAISLNTYGFHAAHFTSTISDYLYGTCPALHSLLNVNLTSICSTDIWYNFVFSRNTDGIYQLFINGELVSSKYNSNKFQIFGLRSDGSSPYYSVGSASMYGKEAHRNFTFHGKLFDFSVIDKGIPTVTNKYKILTPYSYWDGRIVMVNDNNEELIIY